MVVNCKGLSCLSVCLCLALISQMPSSFLSLLEILNLLSAPFVSGGHGRAASLGTVAASMGPGVLLEMGGIVNREGACVNREGEV